MIEVRITDIGGASSCVGPSGQVLIGAACRETGRTSARRCGRNNMARSSPQNREDHVIGGVQRPEPDRRFSIGTSRAEHAPLRAEQTGHLQQPRRIRKGSSYRRWCRWRRSGSRRYRLRPGRSRRTCPARSPPPGRLPASRSDRRRSATRGTVRPARITTSGWLERRLHRRHQVAAGEQGQVVPHQPVIQKSPPAAGPDRPATSRTRTLRMSGRCRQCSTRPAKAADAGSPSVTMARTAGIPSCGRP